MRSRVAEESRRALAAVVARLSPAERLEAFLAHSRLLIELRRAAQLTAVQVDYAVIGAMAAAVHGAAGRGTAGRPRSGRRPPLTPPAPNPQNAAPTCTQNLLVSVKSPSVE
jgi:hypothetical protein